MSAAEADRLSEALLRRATRWERVDVLARRVLARVAEPRPAPTARARPELTFAAVRPYRARMPVPARVRDQLLE